VEVDANGVGMFMITTFPEADMQRRGIVLPKNQMPAPGPVAMVWNPETAAWVSHLGEIKAKMIGIKDTLQKLQTNPIQAASAVKADVEWLIHFVGNTEKLAGVFEAKLKEEVPKIIAARKRMMAEAEAQMKARGSGDQGQ
jgi:hypothetical protein